MKCFVIMPFGEKQDPTGLVMDFDEIHEYLIKRSVERLNHEHRIGVEPMRCDEIWEAGWVHKRMFDWIYQAKVAIVDITFLNPNVFYELGVRHALADSVTVLIKRSGTKTPFNIQDLSVIEYDPASPRQMDEAMTKIGAYIRNGLDSGHPDSPVHQILKLRVQSAPERLTCQDVFSYAIRRREGRQIAIVTGDIQHVELADVWVNSENVYMQMARHYDRSISGVIRYFGARRGPGGQVEDDLIADELARIVPLGQSVPPTTVIVTGAGALEATNRVKKIFHAASVVGAPAEGFSPIAGIERCVTNALRKMDSPECRDANLRTILFPLMGTGTGRGSLEEVAGKLIGCAVDYLKQENTAVEKVFFIALTDRELAACRRILHHSPDVAEIAA
jgi:O-acetyl-ADP-ribose deacetylase (regulator of RNase III)